MSSWNPSESTVTNSGTPQGCDKGTTNLEHGSKPSMSSKQKGISPPHSIISLSSSRDSPKNITMIDLTSDNDAEMDQPLRQANSVSSELTEISSDRANSSRNDQISSEGRRNNADAGRDSSSGGSSSSSSSGLSMSSSSRSEQTESDEDRDEDIGASSSAKKGLPRDDRLRLRDILNKKLEQMFTTADIELTSYGRIPWTRLGESLSAQQLYISGFPEELEPRAVNDKLHPGSAPSTWGSNRSKPLIELIDAGKIHILPTPPGRRVLFELIRPDGSKYDSTLGYSSQWLHEHMPSAFPSAKRPRSEMRSKSQSTQPKSKGKAKALQEESNSTSSQTESSSESEDDSISWLPHRKRPKLAESSSPSLNEFRSSRLSQRSSIQTRTRKSTGRDGDNKQAKNKNQPIKQGERWKEGGIVKKVGRGWIVIEESTSDDDGLEDTKSMEESADSSQPETTTTAPVPIPAPKTTSSPAPAQNTQKRKRSEPPESFPRKRINNSNANLPSSSPNDILSQISRLIHDAGYSGTKKLPWSSLPEFLASKNLYITGFPSICLPEVNNDEVASASSPTHWKPPQRTAMEEAFKKDQVKIVPRPPGRNVLFEVLDPDKSPRDSLLSYSDAWAAAHIKESPVQPPDESTDGDFISGSATSSPTSATRPKPPSLKIVIPDTGERLGDTRPNPSGPKPPKPSRKGALQPEKAEKLAEQISIPRADLPTPVIYLQPPTPPQEKANTLAPEKLQLDDPPIAESPNNIKPTTSEDTPKSPKNLSLPPSPSTDDPVSRPSPEDVTMASPVQAQTQPSQNKVARFTFKIPPAKKIKSSKGKHVAKHRKADDRAGASDDDSSSLTDESMSIDQSLSTDGAKGYDLALLFDSPNRENPDGGLPSHLRPKLATPAATRITEIVPANASANAKALQQALVKPSEIRRPNRLLDLDQEIVGVIKSVPRTPLDTKNSVEKHVRPALVKLFDAAGLSSPSTPLPWVMLPIMLCRNRLFISGFPVECLPKVTRDKVEGHCGPRSWSFPALQAMYYALKAGEVKIRRRPKGRRVLFHLLPTDAQRERGEYHGTDTTLSFSRAWLDEYMADDDNFNGDFDNNGNMIIEPTEESIQYQRPALTPLRRESVWERFGKIKIDEDSTDSEQERVPDPPWKRALEEFTRPISSYENSRSSATNLMKINDVSNQSDGSDDSDESDSGESVKKEESDEEEDATQFPLNRLLPSHIPQAFQGKGRILLVFGDVFEWFPNDPYATDVPPTRLIWNPAKMKWKLLPDMRFTMPFMKKLLASASKSTNRPGMDDAGDQLDIHDSSIPNRVTGRVLSKGVCEHNPVRDVWECSFVGRETFGNLWWSPDVGAWEWTLGDPDGRRKWLGRESPDRIYSQIEKMEK